MSAQRPILVEVLASYRTPGGEQRHVELVADPRLPSFRLIVDRGAEGAPLLVGELDRNEGRDHALAVLHAGGYLERARAGEPRLCAPLTDQPVGATGPARAA